MSLFPSVFVPLPFSLCMESTSYVFPYRLVFFYLVTTDWILGISFCDSSINQSINQSIITDIKAAVLQYTARITSAAQQQ